MATQKTKKKPRAKTNRPTKPAKSTQRAKPATRSSSAGAAASGAPSFDALVALLGAAGDDEEVVAFRKAWRMRVNKTDKVKGEPRASFARNEKLDVHLALEDDVVVGFSVGDATALVLPKGVSVSSTRAQLATAWGTPEETHGAFDTFRMKLGGHDVRVTTNTGKGALWIDVELARLQDERAARASASIDASIEGAGPARTTRALSPAAQKLAPDVAAILGSIGARLDSAEAKALVKALGLTGQASDGVLMSPDVFLGVEDDKIASVSTFAGWGGGLERGLVNGVASRADVRRALGDVAFETESFDLFETNGVRRTVSYLDGRVAGWSVDPHAPPLKDGRRRARKG